MFKKYLGSGDVIGVDRLSVNLLCQDSYSYFYKMMGLEVVLDLSSKDYENYIPQAHGASLNIVQDSVNFLQIAEYMREEYGTPYILISTDYMGINDLYNSLCGAAGFFELECEDLIDSIVLNEADNIISSILKYRKYLEGNTVSITIHDYHTRDILRDIMYRIGVNTDFDTLGGDVVIGSSELENGVLEMDKCFCSIKNIENIHKRGYKCILNLYDKIYKLLLNKQSLLQLGSSPTSNLTNMSVFA